MDIYLDILFHPLSKEAFANLINLPLLPKLSSLIIKESRVGRSNQQRLLFLQFGPRSTSKSSGVIVVGGGWQFDMAQYSSALSTFLFT